SALRARYVASPPPFRYRLPPMKTERQTRAVRIGEVIVGGGHPVAVQSMCATKTRDVEATVEQVHQLAGAGADIVRIAVDNEKEVAALKEIRAETEGIPLS